MGCKFSTSVRTEVVIAEQEARISVQDLAQQIHFSTNTSCKICHDDLSLIPYIIQLSQPLSEDGIAKRCAFGRGYRILLENNPGVLNVTEISNETLSHVLTSNISDLITNTF
jgi:hypothetical protein